MKELVTQLALIGQTQSIHQVDSVQQMSSKFNMQNQAFQSVFSQSFDQVCMQFPEDDED